MSNEKKESSKKNQEKKTDQEKHEWNERAKEIWLAGLGALSAVEEEGSKLFRSLVERGTSFEKKRKEQMDELWKDVSEKYEKAEDRFEESFDKAEERIENRMKSLISGLGIPTRKEIQELSMKVDALNKKIDQIKEKQSAKGKGTGKK
jgi:poly(hydroxyalkanoate) granule-associated protein